MEINDAKTVRKVLNNIKEAGGNAKHFINLIKRHDSITKSLSQLENQLPPKKAEFDYLKSKIQEFNQDILQLQREKEQLQDVIKSQENIIGNNSYHLNRIQYNLTELEKRREALISYIAKQLNLPPEEILRLRLRSDYELVLAEMDNLLTDYIKNTCDVS